LLKSMSTVHIRVPDPLQTVFEQYKAAMLSCRVKRVVTVVIC
jgi:hypothetical protein